MEWSKMSERYTVSNLDDKAMGSLSERFGKSVIFASRPEKTLFVKLDDEQVAELESEGYDVKPQPKILYPCS
jgi:hypothetical protein